MVYFTGDIHGDPRGVTNFSDKHKLTKNDTIILLGDVGANYYQNKHDWGVKSWLDSTGVNILCIHGNHEMRPSNIDTYKLTEWNGGKVWVEEDFPNLKFAKDGEIYNIEGLRYIAIGGPTV